METFILLLRRLWLLLALLLAAWFCWANRLTLAAVAQLAPLDFLRIFLSYLLCYLLAALMLCLVLRNRGQVVPLLQLLTLDAWAALLGHSTLLRDGTNAGKAAYYRQLYRIPLTLSLGLLALLGLVGIFTNATIGIFTGVWAFIGTDLVLPPVYWLVLGSTLLLGVSIVLGIRKRGGVDRLPRRLKIWIANLHAVATGTNHNEVIALIALVALALPLRAFAFSLLFKAFGMHLPPVYLLIVAIFSGLSLALSVTPANLGIKELVILLVLAPLNLPLVALVSVLVIDRVLQLFLVLVLSLGGWLRLRKAPGQAAVSLR